MMKQFRADIFTIISTLALIFVIGGIVGFVYEVIFYRFDLGYFVKRGTTFGPWIPIYGFGALLIAVCTYWLRKRWWLVVLTGGAVCGALEFITGYLLYHVSGIRLWDYNTEILNAGNIGGYICFRSVGLFALSSLLLVYTIIPMLIKLQKKRFGKAMNIAGMILGTLFFVDFFISNFVFN